MSELVIARTQALTAGTALTKIGSTVFPAAAIEVTITGSGASLAAAVMTIVGLDEDGAAQNEVLPITAVGSFTSVNQWSSITSLTPSGIVFTGYSGLVTFEDGYADVNGDEDTTDYESLLTLRTRLLRRLGYSAQAASPPPGMADLLTDFLQSSQRFWYRKFKEQRAVRFFTWVMTPGTRFFTIANNQDISSARLDPLKVVWAGISDQNQSWMPLAAGIPPEGYTLVTERGMPGRYEIRQNIEVLPAPDRAYRLRIKGGFKLGSFSADGDTTSIDSELVFLWALANAKNHYGQGDADDVATQARSYYGNIIADKHGTNRYVPGASPVAPIPKPRFLPLEE